MPITALALITVTGTYLKLDGTPASGTVTFTPRYVLVNPTADEIIYPIPFTAVLDGTGSFSIELPATNDPDLSPAGWTYEVAESINGSAVSRAFDIELPHDTLGSTIDMADISPAIAVPEVTSYVLISTFNAAIASLVTLNTAQTITGKTFSPAAASGVGLIVKGLASQTGNLQEWQNSSGTALARITPTGGAYFGGPVVINSYVVNSGGDYVLYSGGSPNNFLIAYGPTHIPLVVRGTVAQSNHLQQWQDSAGTALAGISAAGAIEFGGGRGRLTGGGTGDPTLEMGAGAAWFTVRSIAGVDLFRVMETSGRVSVGNPYPAVTAKFEVWGTEPAQPVSFLRGVAAQTADLQQWQNSSGTVLAAITATGTIYTAAEITSGPAGAIIGVKISSSSGGATQIPFVARGHASQTADLQQWQNSAGAVLAYVRSDGAVYTNALGGVSASADLFLGDTADTGYLTVRRKVRAYSPTAASTPLIVWGAASQTGDLQQWVDNASTVLAKVNSAGGIWASSFFGPAGSNVGSTYFVSDTNAGPYIAMTGSMVFVGNRGTTTNAVLVAQGMLSQTGDLQQWQNSVGTILALVSATGSVSAPTFNARASVGLQGTIALSHGDANTGYVGWHLPDGTRLGYMGYSILHVVLTLENSASFVVRTSGAGSTSAPTVIVQGMAAQTGDLQQWQNSAGAVLAKITSSGAIFTADNLTASNVLTTSIYSLDGYQKFATASGGGPIIAHADLEIATIGQGFILKSPDGTRYRIAVANGGAISAVAA